MHPVPPTPEYTFLRLEGPFNKEWLRFTSTWLRDWNLNGKFWSDTSHLHVNAWYCPVPVHCTVYNTSMTIATLFSKIHNLISRTTWCPRETWSKVQCLKEDDPLLAKKLHNQRPEKEHQEDVCKVHFNLIVWDSLSFGTRSIFSNVPFA